jgi:hypothetical protein
LTLQHKVLVGSKWINRHPVDGEIYRIDLNGTVIQSPVTFAVPVEPTAEEYARQFRNLELCASDYIVPLTDHPKHAEIVVYRQELRDWPDTNDFPDTRPINPLEV